MDIEWHDPRSLRPHYLNLQIYGEDSHQDLVESIAKVGVLEPLYIRPDMTIISGHRRWRAALGGLSVCPLYWGFIYR